MSDEMLSFYGGFVHVPTQRTGYLKDGPFHYFDKSGGRTVNGRYPILYTEWEVVWDDTGKTETLNTKDLKWVPISKRHFTDGKRICHCGATHVDGIVIHRSPEEQCN